ncbi:unnamed protein product [Microthlaspi erraticum]|uniref:Uncharacterized protein n=1 Tax=Microthlaspi erraticum TaxID=1685480 RepID=A0A6D2K6A4_9BRAS|nr:unnamed protein product [Microthlaspi erraticum]
MLTSPREAKQLRDHRMDSDQSEEAIAKVGSVESHICKRVDAWRRFLSRKLTMRFRICLSIEEVMEHSEEKTPRCSRPFLSAQIQ